MRPLALRRAAFALPSLAALLLVTPPSAISAQPRSAAAPAAAAPAASAPLAAVPSDPEAEVRAARAAMDRLALLEGDWAGEVSVARGPGPRILVQQVERIRRAAAGTALIIEGTGRLPEAAAGAVPAFEAIAVITWDAGAGRYHMLAAGGTGRALVLEPEVRDDGLTWAFDAPGGARVRYVITIEQGTRWRETGATSLDGGATWLPFLTMDLRKRVDAGESEAVPR